MVNYRIKHKHNREESVKKGQCTYVFRKPEYALRVMEEVPVWTSLETSNEKYKYIFKI